MVQGLVVGHVSGQTVVVAAASSMVATRAPYFTAKVGFWCRRVRV
jgi:hypothetical protein